MLRRFAPVVSKSCLPIATTALAFRWATTDVKVPFIAESIDSGKVAEIIKKVGDWVEEDELIFKIESDKQAVEIMAPHAGVVTSLPSDGETVKVGQVVSGVDKDGKKPEGAAKSEPSKDAAPKEEKKEEKKEKKDDSSSKAAAPARPATTGAPAAPSVSGGAAPSAPTLALGGDARVTREAISPMRQRIADRLKASQNTAAMLTTFNEIDMTNLIALRAKYKDAFLKRHNVKLGFMSPFVKASAIALQEVPIINASWTPPHIEYHNYVDISVAVAAKNGLVVPVLRDVQNMNFADIEKKIEEFGDKAKKGKITVPEMLGGTFTISNGGTFGSWMGTPIINPPQSAILGMHAVKKKPWVNEKGEIVIRDIMAVALTYDHRIIDGRDAVTFLVKIKNCIEDPQRIVLDLP